MRRILPILLLIMTVLFSVQIKAAKAISDEEFSRNLINKFHQIHNSTSLKKAGKIDRSKNNMTMLLYQAKKNANRLTPEAKALFKTLSRPAGFTKTYEETTKNFFRFYYSVAGADSVDVTDANNNGTPDYIENMAAAFVRALSVYDSLGYSRPPVGASDNGRYCVYLSDTLAGDYVYGYTDYDVTIGDNPATTIVENSSTTSYMVMRNDYIGFGSTAAELQIAMEVTAAHEFFHAVQFGYETNNMTGFFMEMCSTWAEDIVCPGDDDNWQYLTNIFDTPDVSLDYDDLTYTSPYSVGHWYAAWIFMRYVTDQYGTDILRNAFEGTISNYDAIALNNLFVAKSTSLSNVIKDYNVALALLTSSKTAPISSYRFSRGDDYRTVTKNSGGSPTGPFVINYEGTIAYNGTKASYSSTTDGNKLLMRAGADFIKIVPSGNFLVTVTPSKITTELSARLIKSDSYTNPTSLSVVDPVISGNSLIINVNDKASYNDYVLVVYNTRYATSTDVRDTSSIQYTITVQDNTPKLSLLAPVGGESWFSGITKNITWSANAVENVKIEFSSDNGSSWSTVVASTPAVTGSYAWTLPNVVSANCEVKISDVSNASLLSVSAAAFSISPAPPIVILAPDGGEVWPVGSAQTVTWASQSSVANVAIDYSVDGGSTWTAIIGSTTASAGSYSWTVPNSLSANCKVRISDVANSATNAISSKAFSIVQSSVVVLTEDFAKMTAGSIATPSGTDVASTLDTYTNATGWTGLAVYQAGGLAKLGASSTLGYIITPVLNLSGNSGNGSIKFDVQTWSNDAKVIQVFLSKDGGTTYAQLGADIPTTATLTTQTVPFTGATSTSKIKITAKTSSKSRFFLDNISVTSGSVLAVESNNSKNFPKDFSLNQNYPNPFNPTTKISFSVPQTDHITLSVYNVQGELVSILINQEMTQGSYSVVFNAASLPSGVYYYRMISSTVNSAKKMILMK